MHANKATNGTDAQYFEQDEGLFERDRTRLDNEAKGERGYRHELGDCYYADMASELLDCQPLKHMSHFVGSMNVATVNPIHVAFAWSRRNIRFYDLENRAEPRAETGLMTAKLDNPSLIYDFLTRPVHRDHERQSG
ncbi:hypothetical protein E6O75_ATG05705 [Venturia nashicola]|uniref:Uncharacterized protein n=1 Tax=Venturia nashicola TaxID=86259 RepID=A0A4Z1PE29_9PEZI|nr:hypothetical protein E6O75_ATG05705 [Venturia nashicola]